MQLEKYNNISYIHFKNNKIDLVKSNIEIPFENKKIRIKCIIPQTYTLMTINHFHDEGKIVSFAKSFHHMFL